jgi:leucyl aminopeptidase
MKYATRSGNIAKSRAQCVVVGIFEDGGLSPSAKVLDKASKGYITKILARGDFSGKAKQTLTLYDVPNVTATRVLLVGLGHENDMTQARYVGIAKAVIHRIKTISSGTNLYCILEVAVPEKSLEWKTQKVIEAFEAGVYEFTKMKGKPAKNKSVAVSIDLFIEEKSRRGRVARAITIGNALTKGINAAKTLGNLPGNICTPTYLANAAKQLAKDYTSVTTKILEEKAIERLGMGAFMSVTRGSKQPGKLIVITYKGGKSKEAPHVLVGKGITFDTGGISLKPGAGMHEMIWDMCGAATVFGTLLAIAEQGLSLNVICVIAAAENMPSGDASRPGDIVKTMSGQTVEILNTDAEGRLVLCDALTYVDQFQPETVIDVATLTGACVVALGSHASAMYANDDDVAATLTKAGENSLDRVWRMPLWDDYQGQINSAFADMANIGGREAGSITAACFLSRYTKKYRWAHLDVAGSAFNGSGPEKGSTGRPVSLLFEYLNNVAA